MDVGMDAKQNPPNPLTGFLDVSRKFFQPVVKRPTLVVAEDLGASQF